MSIALLSSVANALRLGSGDTAAASQASLSERHPCTFSHREWARHLGVLDRCGLTLPFYARILATDDCEKFPRQTIKALEERRIDNTNRMQAMLRAFGIATQALQNAGVNSICVKGFSLFPEFLEQPWQRHQIDFDFLIAPEDGLQAQSALEELGYKLTAVASDGERRLRIPVTRAPSHHDYVYAPQESAAIELHSHFREPEAGDAPLVRLDRVFEQAKLHTVGPVSFLRLSPPHAFLYQVFHFYRHFRGSWARPLWPYEIASFIERHFSDDELWQSVAAILSTDAPSTEAAALVMLTAKQIFACPIPPALQSLCAQHASDPIGLWVRHYARRWLLTDMPGNKLNLLLQRRSLPDTQAGRGYLAGRLIPRGKRPVLCEGIEPGVARSLKYQLANMRYQAARAFYHLRTGAGFWVANIAWSRRLRSSHDHRAPNELRRSES
jgi:Uncharacterised nucleotidyltransferase